MARSARLRPPAADFARDDTRREARHSPKQEHRLKHVRCAQCKPVLLAARSAELAGAEIGYVNVGAEPDVVGEVPADVVGIVVDNDVVVVPAPIVARIVIVLGDAEEEAAEPEAVARSAFNAPNMGASNCAGEAAVFPGMIEMVVTVVAAGVVADPAIVFGVDVRSFGVRRLVAIGAAVIAWLAAAIVPLLSAAIMVIALCGLMICGGASGRDVSAADVAFAAALVSSVLVAFPAVAALLLSECRNRHQHEREEDRKESHELFHLRLQDA